MRYQNLKSFYKHLENSASGHLCRFYLVAISDDFERARTIDAILRLMQGSARRFTGADCDVGDCLDAMQTMSLFGESIVVLDEAEKLSKKQSETLVEHLRAPAGYVVFGARSKAAGIAGFVEKEGVVVDLLEEKVWDKEKRLSEQLAERAAASGKRLSSDAAHLLLERLGVDAALLESELNKLLCYIGERSAIERADILAISPLSRLSTLWQTAEEVVWEGGEFPSVDSASFHGLVPALRNQLHLGMVLSSLIEEGCPSDQWSRFLPKLWPKTLDKRSAQAARMGSAYFRKGLEKLFEIELVSRSSATQYRALLDLFRAELYAG